MWQCPRCKREFKKKSQSHSCVIYPIEQHFKGKDYSRDLFEKLVKEIEEEVGKIKIESLPCCIHLVSNYTFSGVWLLRDKIRLDFRVDYQIDSERIIKQEKLSTNRNLYYVELKDEEDIDKELLKWITDSYFLNK
ncbi:hypothetical protein KBB69_02175 [Candidatus Dojkabacteria bacterium]|nr:hypothetical protein [Candidatus Dojkabacteria bacterium]